MGFDAICFEASSVVSRITHSINMVVDRAVQFVLMLDALTTEQKQKVSDFDFNCLFKLQPLLVSCSLIGTLSKAYHLDT